MTTGPVQILVVGFEHPQFDGSILAELQRLKESDVVRLVDLIVVRKDDDGNIERVLRSDLSTEEAQEFGAFVGALIGLGMEGEDGMEVGAALGAAVMEDGHLFSDTDSWYVDDAIPPGSAAAIALIEHRWAIPLREAIESSNGFHLADAWIHPVDLVAVGLLAADEAARQGVTRESEATA
jgi:uncharacterized membrane protein